jgi:hypothetical protein
MLNLKTNPNGIDIQIQELQTILYNNLKIIWGINDEIQYESFGRVYKNKNESGYVPEVFISSLISGNTSYREVYFDLTNNSVVSFFSISDSIKYDIEKTVANISIIFILNIAKLKPTIQWRADEEIKNDIIKQIKISIVNYSKTYKMLITGFETGFKNVFKEFSGIINNDTLTYMDIHPIFNFKVNMTTNYIIFNS